ncbi:hypothetical protein Csa_012194 [Cucumis sativus]|uniref:Uncharacterized protein n=1 Tax=Cucumis sativus TaxID=3659 RepID=A0A0A0L1E0_CUCSA|nr:hypothetical protein Csa_012194 [Cucumis sativus]
MDSTINCPLPLVTTYGLRALLESYTDERSVVQRLPEFARRKILPYPMHLLLTHFSPQNTF